MDALSSLLIAIFALATGILLGAWWTGRRMTPADPAQLSAATQQAVEPVTQSLDRFESRLRELEASRIDWHAQLREQVESVRATNDSLRRETAGLATALRRPHVRGHWGELHLKRAAELAGMVDQCDFHTQVQVTDSESTQRPDMVVALAGGSSVVVDAKVPLDAYLDALDSNEPDEEIAHYRRHVKQLKSHIDQLSTKAYWKQFASAPEFVVLFLPSESMLSSALRDEPQLLEYAARQRIVLATPTSLIALLRTVAFGWNQQALSDNAREIQAEAKVMYSRIGTVMSHLDKLGSGLNSTVAAYNNALASIETRLLPSARRLRDLGVSDEKVKSLKNIDVNTRQVVKPETENPLPSQI